MDFREREGRKDGVCPFGWAKKKNDHGQLTGSRTVENRHSRGAHDTSIINFLTPVPRVLIGPRSTRVI